MIFDELEGRTNGRNSSFRWDGQGWIGTDFYGGPIPDMRYFDWQAGVRIDLDSGPTRAWLAIGVQGLAPYFFNFEPTIYFRDGGRVAGRLQGYYGLYFTQRLILQPQVEINLYSQADSARRIGTGLSDLDGGVRLGYQFSRKFAPYVGYVYSGAFGGTAKFSRQAGEPTSASQIVFGIWLWH
jgi:copper resistance protein B